MSIVELAGQRLPEVLPLESHVQERQDLQNSFVRQFLAKEIDSSNLRGKLLELGESRNRTILPTPGHLYPLLKNRIGLPANYVKNIVREERAHFLTARKAGLKSSVAVEFSKEPILEDPEVSEIKIHIFTLVELPKDIDSERMREALKAILVAPTKFQLELSQDDLAKLP